MFLHNGVFYGLTYLLIEQRKRTNERTHEWMLYNVYLVTPDKENARNNLRRKSKILHFVFISHF